MVRTKQPRTSRITKALSHYEAALSLFQQELATLPPEKRMEIEHLAQQLRTAAAPYNGPYLTLVLHEAGDVFRAAKQIIDPNGFLSSSTPDLPEPTSVG